MYSERLNEEVTMISPFMETLTDLEVETVQIEIS
jgi:hypothetical protein